MKAKQIVKINSIEELHKALDYGEVKHPLITLIEFDKVKFTQEMESVKVIMKLYGIMFKTKCVGEMTYGRRHYDFSSGVLNFMEPDQAMTMENIDLNQELDGWGLYFHPDLIRRSSLGDKIRNYTFLSYENNEALHLSDREKEIIERLKDEIVVEFNSNIDIHSHGLINLSLELLFNYSERFYGRQFITRENLNKDTVEQFKAFLNKRIYSDMLEEKGIPSVKECAAEMCLSANYLSDMLRKETGKNTKEYINSYVMDRAKSILLNSDTSVKEIAYKLGFDDPSYFGKFFKKIQGISPTEYRTTLEKEYRGEKIN